MFTTPVLLVVFNRPDFAKIVIDKIREVKPSRIYVAADGPRSSKDGELELCSQTREVVKKEVDWDCELFTLFREENLGAGKGVSSAITWFFEHEEAGIILEDDCLPDKTFFYFCQELLEKYEKDDRIMHISGNNYQFSQVGDGSYYFSRFTESWGWATWRRAWKKFDFDVIDHRRKDIVDRFVFSKGQRNYFRKIFKLMDAKMIDCWDYQWHFCCLLNDGLAIIPQNNLIKNIGFGERSTHTSRLTPKANLKVYPIENIIHPTEVRLDLNAEKWHLENSRLEYESLIDIIKHRIRVKLRYFLRGILKINK